MLYPKYYSERRFYKEYLLKHYKPEEIIYNSKGTPDFLTKDGKKWEVKRIIHRADGSGVALISTENQEKLLREDPTIYIALINKEIKVVQVKNIINSSDKFKKYENIEFKSSTYRPSYTTVSKKKIVAPIIAGDRIIIPKKFREKLGIKKGDFVIVRLEGKELKIIPASIKPK